MPRSLFNQEQRCYGKPDGSGILTDEQLLEGPRDEPPGLLRAHEPVAVLTNRPRERRPQAAPLVQVLDQERGALSSVVGAKMRVLLSTHGSRGDRTMLGLAVQLGTLDAKGCDALVAAGVAPAGVWR
jgi:hypothetical protein